jgi:hypothetical protein
MGQARGRRRRRRRRRSRRKLTGRNEIEVGNCGQPQTPQHQKLDLFQVTFP